MNEIRVIAEYVWDETTKLSRLEWLVIMMIFVVIAMMVMVIFVVTVIMFVLVMVIFVVIVIMVIVDWLIDCFTAHQHRKAISAKKRC